MATISNNEIKIKYSLDTTDLANATALFDRLSSEDRQLLNDLKKLQAQLTATGQAGTNAGNQISNATRKASKDFDLLGSSIKQVGTYIGTYLSIQALVSFGKQILTVTKNFESLQKAIEFTSGTMTQGMKNFEFLRDLAEQLGLPLQTAAEAFKSFSAAAQRANMSMEQQQSMFTDLAKAMSALQVTATDAQLIFYGLSQMMSKPKVQTQELVLQIGEKLPIAMQAATIALARMQGVTSVTTGELMKMVSEGKILSEKFVPEFTKALGELAGDSAYVETLGKGLTRLSNAWDEMLLAMGESRKGFIKDTVDGLTEMFNSIQSLFPESKAKRLQIFSYDMEKENIKQLSEAGKAYTKEQLEQIIGNLETTKVAEAQKLKIIEDGLDKGRKAAMKGIGGKVGFSLAETLGLIPDEMKEAIQTQDQLTLSIADTQGKIDAYTEALKNLLKVKKEDSTANDKELNEYKKLIAQQEALMKAEEDLIKSRTLAGENQDILIIENRIRFNNEMLKIDERAEFAKLELAKNNAVKRKAELQKDADEEQEIVRQARFKAFAAEQEYLDKSLEFIKEGRKKRKQELQTDEQNELEDSKNLVNEQLKVLKEKYDETKKIEGQSKNSLEILELNYQTTVTNLTEEGEKQREAIRAKYRAKEKEEIIQAELNVRSTVVEAATIRNKALVKSESEKADIADEGAITQLNIKKEENNKLAQLQLDQGNLTEYQREIINNKLVADNTLVDAQITEIVKQGELRRLQEREDKAKMVMQIGQTLADGLFQIYNQQLNNELTVLNNKYSEEVRLADGNKQKLAQLEQDKREKEKEIKIRQFKAEQAEATAKVIFATATQLMASALEPALIPYIIGLSVAQLAMIAAQPVPEFAEGTKGRKFKGGPAIVGERGVEKVITESGKVYFTPDHASLVELPKGSQVIPNHSLSHKEIFWASTLNNGKPIAPSTGIESRLDKIGGILEALPVHQINMNEKGFEKFVRTPRRTTKILNNQFPVKHL